MYLFYHFHSLHEHLVISRVIAAECFVFLMQVTNHQPTRCFEFALPKIALVAIIAIIAIIAFLTLFFEEFIFTFDVRCVLRKFA